MKPSDVPKISKSESVKQEEEKEKNMSFLELMHHRAKAEKKLKMDVLEKRRQDMQNSYLRETNVNTVRIQLDRYVK